MFFSMRRGGLCIVLTLFSVVRPGTALTIPLSPDSLATAAPDPEPMLKLMHESPRADSDIVTLFGTFDTSTVDDEAVDGEPKLMPIKDVLQAMFTQPPPSPSIAAPLSMSVESASQSTPSFTSTAISPLASPPRQGPGIVLVSTALPGFTATSASVAPSNTSSTAADDALNRNAPSSNRMLILGSIIGGIICVTVILFFMLDPSISGRLCGFCPLRRFKRSKPDRGISNIADPAFSSQSLDAPGSLERTFIGMDERKGSPSPEKGGEDTLVDVDINASSLPVSKFSICSSDYLSASTRDSGGTATSLSASIRPARPSVVTFASPVRPPRPPTADSPALSDSVYFACERQPYVVAQGRERGGRTDSRGAPKKNLTPSEFFALHVPAILSSLAGAGKPEGASRERIASAVSAKRSSGTGSHHSRTKSAPLLGLGMHSRRVSKSPKAILEDDDDEAALRPGEIVQKVTKHRRSRSASGWAYPDRPRTRKVVNV